jgi:nucleoside-diphosphate-sugar epimerase
VTGATGFIGNSLVEKLLDIGYDVIPVGMTLKPWTSDFIRENLHKIDLVTERIPDLGKIDCACLLASKQPYKENEWNRYYEINSKQIFHFLNNNINQLIYISTTTVNPVNGIPNPMNHYGLSKALGERLLKINNNHFTQTSVIRFPSVMGINHHGGIINDFKVWAENNEEIILYDGGKTFRNIIHVNEAVAAIMNVINSFNELAQFEVFDVGSKDSITLTEIAETMVRLMKKDITITLSDKATDCTDVFVDNSDASFKLGYVPKTIEDGIKQYLNDCNYEV